MLWVIEFVPWGGYFINSSSKLKLLSLSSSWFYSSSISTSLLILVRSNLGIIIPALLFFICMPLFPSFFYYIFTFAIGILLYSLAPITNELAVYLKLFSCILFISFLSAYISLSYFYFYFFISSFITYSFFSVSTLFFFSESAYSFSFYISLAFYFIYESLL
jgi:hypothetical protein